MNPKKNKVSLFAGIVAIFASAVAAPNVLGQVETPVNQVAKKDVLEEIVITASKVGETLLQETPISITAFTGEDLERSGIKSVDDLSAITPSLSTSRNYDFGQVYIRGIGTNLVFPGSDSSVTVHLDGVYLGRPGMLFADFVDLERIEVVRGPQGTLYGRNSVGGTINLIPKLPSEELEADFSAEYGNYDQTRFSGSVRGTVADGKVGLALSGLYSTRDGYVKNADPNGSDLDDEDTKGIRGTVRFFPTEGLEVRLSADYLSEDGTGAVFKQTGLTTLGTPAAGIPGLSQPNIPSDFRTVRIPNGTPPTRVKQEADREYYGYTAHIKLDLSDNWELTSITSLRGYDIFQAVDSDGSDADERLSFLPEEQDQLSQELQISGRVGNLDLVAGLFYFQEESSTDTVVTLPGLGNAFFGAPDFNINFDTTVDTEAYAVFIQGKYDVTDKLSVTIGGRYNEEDKDINQVIGTRFGDVFRAGQPVVFEDSASFTDFTPKFGIDYMISEDILGYFTATKGFKSGGFNFSVAQSAFDPEQLWAYEVGIKSDWFDDRLRLNASAFYYDYEDLQVQQFVAATGTPRVEITNAATARVIGFELETVAMPTANLKLSAGLSYLDATYDEFVSQRASANTVDIDLSGNRLSAAPEWSANLSAQYSKQVSDLGEASIRVDYQWIDEQFYTPFSDPNARQGSYSLLNANISLLTLDEKWEFSIYGRNLRDEEYISSVLDFARSGVLTNITAPRTYGFRVSYSYF